MTTIAVLGATGGTGQLVVKELLRRGIAVTAVVRDPSAYRAPDGVTVHKADVLDPTTLNGAFDDVDAVISALGPRDGKAPTTVYSAGTANVIGAMRSARIGRLVVISAVPVSPPEENTFFLRRILHPILWHFFGQSYQDLRVMESELATTSDIDWTVVRPPLLTDDSAQKHVRRGVDQPLSKPKKVSRTDLAKELVDITLEQSLSHRTVTVSY